MENKKRVLILEDDFASATFLQTMLLKDGYEISAIVDSGERAIDICKELKPDIILTDVMLTGKLSGGEAVIQIKQFLPKCKIIFLTAYAEEDMIDFAIRSNACAYLMKPYRAKEILATIKVALCNHTDGIHMEYCAIIHLVDGFVFNRTNNRLYKDSKEVPLSEKKLKLIALLAKNRNNTVSNRQMSNVLWGEDKSTSTLRSLIHRLRMTLKSDILENINGVGYRLL